LGGEERRRGGEEEEERENLAAGWMYRRGAGAGAGRKLSEWLV